ncbi:MAG: YdeI/OmpD-associated family protein [Myxococcales bacterium]|nr:YdeI/OmpD-associated family protein [Myxococcales bacterium]
MPPVTTTLEPVTRAAWRAWLAAHHADRTEIWLLRHPDAPITYLDAVEEAMCFGWIDGIAKRHGDFQAQRFTPRRPRGNWTELNKERARRLIAAGKMTEAGHRTLPDLDPARFVIPADIEARLRAEPGAWAHFSACPPLYQRVRVGNVEERRKRDPEGFEKGLATLVKKAAAGVMWGNWDDRDMARTPD